MARCAGHGAGAADPARRSQEGARGGLLAEVCEVLEAAPQGSGGPTSPPGGPSILKLSTAVAAMFARVDWAKLRRSAGSASPASEHSSQLCSSRLNSTQLHISSIVLGVSKEFLGLSLHDPHPELPVTNCAAASEHPGLPPHNPTSILAACPCQPCSVPLPCPKRTFPVERVLGPPHSMLAALLKL